MTFGQKIKEARIKKEMTQKELAKKIGAKHNSISNWENDQNKPDPNTIELLCGVLEISPSFLLSGGGVSPEIINPHESSLIKKYRTLDDRGKANVDNLLETEYQYVVKQFKEYENEQEEEYIPQTIAAHNDGEWTEAHDRDIAMGIELVRKKREREKREKGKDS